jgi:phosphoglycolate phosphatase
MRSPVLLWDIDGTLMRSPGIGLRSFARALEVVTGRPIAKVAYDFGGKTDPVIAADLLSAVGADDPALIPAMLAEVERAYDDYADELCAAAATLPGVPELLSTCSERRVRQTVVTGNIEFVARRKLAAIGVDAHLDLDRGAYGSDHPDRTQLVQLAIERLTSQSTIDRSDVWIIGDTPRDAACAREAGVRCLLVATGTYDAESLADLGAQEVLDDLADVDRVLSVLGVPAA